MVPKVEYQRAAMHQLAIITDAMYTLNLRCIKPRYAKNIIPIAAACLMPDMAIYNQDRKNNV